MARWNDAALYPALLFAGFALRYPWNSPTEAQALPHAVAFAPAWRESAPARASDTVPFAPVASDVQASPEQPPPMDGEYTDESVRLFASEPALLDLIDDHARDSDAEVREEAGAALAHASSGAEAAP